MDTTLKKNKGNECEIDYYMRCITNKCEKVYQ